MRSINQALAAIAGAMLGQTGIRLRVNDISLPQGGTFDIANNWIGLPPPGPGHDLHRGGKHADVGLSGIASNNTCVPYSQQLLQLIIKNVTTFARLSKLASSIYGCLKAMRGHEIVAVCGFILLVSIPTTVPAADCVYPSMAKVRPDVRTAVQKVDEGYKYIYSIFNRPNAEQVLESFAIEIQTDQSGLVEPQAPPPHWQAFGFITNSPFYMWGSFEEPIGLRPGERSVFRLVVSKRLPAIQSFLAWGHVEPPSFPEGGAQECEGAEILKNNFRARAVTPRSVQRPIVFGEFLNYLIALTQKSRQHGWIRDDQTATNLRETLRQAKRRLENGNVQGAQEKLDSFINDVQAVSCTTIECDGKPLTSEGYALLFYNARFLARHLRGQPE